VRICCEIRKIAKNQGAIPLTILFFLILGLNSSCTNRQRLDNYTWQLDSLRCYTVKIDSLLKVQNKEMAGLKVDLYTKSNELSEKNEMLNTRLGDIESQLTLINERFSTKTKHPTPAESLSQTRVSPETRLIYESAYLNYVKGNYSEAIDGFTTYLKLASQSPLADNALYWIGECYAALGKRQSAVNTFQELINKYPKSTRKPTALFKLGVIYEEANDKKQALIYYKQILKDYPNSPEASLVQDKVNQK